jgi:hypothetical protein
VLGAVIASSDHRVRYSRAPRLVQLRPRRRRVSSSSTQFTRTTDTSSSNHYMGLIQVETPYFQTLPSGATTAPPSPSANANMQPAGNTSVSASALQRANAIAAGSKHRRSERRLERRSAAIPSGWTAGGCVVDVAARVLQGYSTTSSSLTATSCISACAAQFVLAHPLGLPVLTHFQGFLHCGHGVRN